MSRKKSDFHHLEEELARELELFAYPSKVWPKRAVDSAGKLVLDVLIVGAGQAGVSLAVGLQREKITNILLVDRNPVGQEGPWVTWARMPTLRTIKELTGPDGRLPSASFRSWYEAQYGQQGWRDLVRIPRSNWMEYLGWVRDALRLPVENDVEVVSIEAEGNRLRVTLKSNVGTRSVLARKVVLATGIDGAGGAHRPIFAQGLPPELCAHSADDIDFERLAGRKVAVLGAGASAFDNAATALEAGAVSVTLFARRPKLSQVNALRYLEVAGFFRNYGSLDDARKVSFMRHYMSLPTPPPADALQRCHAYPNFDPRYGETWTKMSRDGDALRIETSASSIDVDFAILGTGFEVDLTKVRYLSPLAKDIVLWRHRIGLEATAVDTKLGRHPYLGSAMEGRGLTPETDKALRNLHFFNIAGVPSVGLVASSINGLPWGSEALVLAISRDLFLEDVDAFYGEFAHYSDPDANEAHEK